MYGTKKEILRCEVVDGGASVVFVIKETLFICKNKAEIYNIKLPAEQIIHLGWLNVQEYIKTVGR